MEAQPIEAQLENMEGQPIESLTGNVEAQPGNVEAQPGNVEAQPGNMEAQPGNMEAQPGNMVDQPENVEGQPGNIEDQPIEAQPGNVEAQPGEIPPQNRPKAKSKSKKKSKKKQPQHSADIVYTKGGAFHTVPSLSKVLKGITDSIVGLQYVWEFRSPSRSVQPHYQCKLCSLCRLQHDMIDHVKGWKHCFRYLKKAHPDKVAFEEEDVIKDNAVKKNVKAMVAEVEQTEGRGQIKVILREPFKVHAFKGMRSALPRSGPPPDPGMGPRGPPFGPSFSNSRFPGEFSGHGGPFTDYQDNEYGDPEYEDYQSNEDYSGLGMDCGPVGHPSSAGGNGFSPGGTESFRSGPLNKSSNKMHPGFQGRQMGDNYMNRPPERSGGMGAASHSSTLSSTLLTYLDSFRIQSESDAQLVLKVTQKLTDVLMEYRLRTISPGPTPSSLPMSSSSFSTPTRTPSSSDRYSNVSGTRTQSYLSKSKPD
uniref:Si:ch211-197h24.6 n=1 Tax=Oryzias latipes TaxID=8090 RepID=A0A3P9KT26_ORYLA